MLAQAASKELYDELLHTDVVDGWAPPSMCVF